MNRYTSINTNHRQVKQCEEYRKLACKVRTLKEEKKFRRLCKQLGTEQGTPIMVILPGK